jgi:phage antirepressor YoqD-like protein
MLNEDQMLLVGMRESKIVRKKVLEWIKTLSYNQEPVFQIPQTLGEALQLAADQAKQLELQAPKVAFVDNCVERGQLMTATQVAQKHKLSAKALNKFLDELGGVYSKSIKRSRVFVQPFINKELGEMKQTEQGYSQALFTAKGEQWVNGKLINEGVI